MRILLVGGTGVLGRSFCRLYPNKADITAIVRSPEKGRVLEQLGVEVREGSILDPASLEKSLSNHEVVLNFASAIPQKSRSTVRDWETNDQLRVQGTSNLLAAIGSKPVFYCQAGIAFLYGDHDGAWVDETSGVCSNGITRSAEEMEHLILNFPHSGMRGVSFRFAAFYHPEAWHTQYMIHELKKRRVPIIGDGSFFWNLIHADDAASAVITILQKRDQISGREIMNISDGEPVLCREMLHHLADLLQVHAPIRIPQFIARIILGEEGFEVLTASYRCKVDKLRSFGWLPRYPSFREGFASVIPILEAS
jgi:nucleoside-diphosphate-sugar epimerase